MNSMPFRQLKSFFKILIGVQYERVKIALSASGTSPKGRGKAVEKPCHCEPVLTLAWQSP